MPGFFAGFDRSVYPGDLVMKFLKSNTNLAWCGYYLAPAPSHSDTSWMTRRAALAAAGWGIAPIYVGRQITGPGTHNPTSANGVTDGHQAANLMAHEGFAPGSFVYLDLENGPPLTQPLTAYVTAWCNTVAASVFRPGVYCSHLLAQNVQQLAPTARIWAFRVPTTQPHAVAGPFPNPDPTGSAFAAAYIWQRDQNCQIVVLPTSQSPLTVDLNSALSADPSAPVLAAATT